MKQFGRAATADGLAFVSDVASAKTLRLSDAVICIDVMNARSSLYADFSGEGAGE